VIAYSGENDPQKQAGDIMAEAFKNEGSELTHLIGPGMGHQYHPDVKEDLLARLDREVQAAIAAKNNPAMAPEAHLQTRTLRYASAGWLHVNGLEEHWREARLDGKQRDGKFEITTKNVTKFDIKVAGSPEKVEIFVDGQEVALNITPEGTTFFERKDGRWVEVLPPAALAPNEAPPTLKLHNRQGPIDDAFLDPFLVVTPSGKSSHPRVQQWVDFELEHFAERWQATFRGQLRTKRDVEVTKDDLAKYHLICFGDAASNKVIANALAKLPLTWSKEKISVASADYDPATHVPLMIYPNPLAPLKYIVLNSGPTFREAHDRTNSLQNPKLPDWAVIDITTHPNASAPGRVVAADFFDEQWQVKK
jgi:hypothetical protein